MTHNPLEVPHGYWGVWVRKLLETPDGRDDSTFVRWLQTARWHADLRVPARSRTRSAEAETFPLPLQQLAQQQGFFGETEVVDAGGDICTWYRRYDFQPPGKTPDAGRMLFETPDQVIETGIHGRYLEVWERLPGSTGRSIALAGLDLNGNDNGERLLVAGQFLMLVRPRRISWPTDTQAGDHLMEVLARYPDQTHAMLDMEISFGTWANGRWAIERSTLPALEGSQQNCRIHRESEGHARMEGERLSGRWQVLAWSE